MGEQRRLDAQAGGYLRKGRKTPEVVKVRKRLWKIADAVLSGELHRDHAIAATQALNAILRSLTVERDLQISEEMFEEIDRLEAQLEQVERARW